MAGWLIVGCEILFWIFLLIGFWIRSYTQWRRMGGVLLISLPFIDLMLLAAAFQDLRSGARAGFLHGFAAIYFGITISFFRRVINWADEEYGSEEIGAEKGKICAKEERKYWFLHLLSWLIGVAIILIMIMIVGDSDKTKELFILIKIWSFVLVFDFCLSFSYSIFPPKVSKKENLETGN